MLKKLGVATLVAAATLAFVAPSYAQTFNGTISTDSVTDVFDITQNGFLYSAGSSAGVLAQSGTAQSVVGPSITVAPALATYTFTYTGSTFSARLLQFNAANTAVFNTFNVSLGAQGVSTTYDFTNIVAAGVGTGTFRYGLLFESNAGATAFSPVALSITAVPEPLEAPAFCMLLVAGGALVLRLRNKSVTTEEADLN